MTSADLKYRSHLPASDEPGHRPPRASRANFRRCSSSAINPLESLQNAASDSMQKFLSGENEELHTTILATQKAELAFELGLQVRNKVVDAYQEIMKMQM